jgi:predicted nucleotidyltransferase
MISMQNQIQDLPEHVQRTLKGFVGRAKDACGTNLLSVILFGSAAEGRLRPTSDVNLVVVLENFEFSQVDQLREILRLAYAAIQLNVMFLLKSEIPLASEAFAVKFTDILSRHRVLDGQDFFANLQVSRSATLQRLQQVIMNLTLRVRERYALVSLREEQLVPLIADVTGPIRASAATILAMEGQKGLHPKEALQELTRKISGGPWESILKNMSLAREEQDLPHGQAAIAVQEVLKLLNGLNQYIQTMK